MPFFIQYSRHKVSEADRSWEAAGESGGGFGAGSGRKRESEIELCDIVPSYRDSNPTAYHSKFEEPRPAVRTKPL